jgi:hypothetical protein
MGLATMRWLLALAALLAGVLMSSPDLVATVAAAAEAAPGASSGGLTPNQLSAGRSLTTAEALAACGPAAAVAFARATGRALTLDAAVAAAREVGWTPERGMTGPYGEQSLLSKLGIGAEVAAGADPARIKRELQAGRPVIIRTGGQGNVTGHYFVAERLDANTGKYDLAQSVLVLRSAAGRRWFALGEIASLGVGAPTHTIYLESSSRGVMLAAASAVPMRAVPRSSSGGGAGSRVVDTGGPGANLRAAPGITAKIVNVLSDGARVTPTGASQTVAGRVWWRVSLANGTAGWMDASLMRTI